MPPPVVVLAKIRHINPRQMIGITEQRVTVKTPCLNAVRSGVWYTAEFMYPPVAYQPHHGSSRFEPAACGPHRAQDTVGRRCEPAPQSPLRFSPQPTSSGAIRKYQSSGAAEIFTQGIPFSRLCSHHEAARLAGAHRSACASRISCSFMMIYCESLLMERKPPKFPVLLRRAHPAQRLQASFAGSAVVNFKFICDSWSRITAFVRAVYIHVQVWPA